LAEIIYREALQEDFPAIRTLIHVVQINPTGLHWRRFIVAVNPTGDLIGCGQIKVHGDGSKELASIAVRETDRGLGVARKIIETLLARETVRPLYLMCRARLEILYIKFGFHVISLKEMPVYFQRISRAEKIFNSRARPEDRLAVMRLD
jgi:N-acetylglutamate synthase-like GNAT family acetyltransferase